jgi:hypothetical protein
MTVTARTLVFAPSIGRALEGEICFGMSSSAPFLAKTLSSRCSEAHRNFQYIKEEQWRNPMFVAACFGLRCVLSGRSRTFVYTRRKYALFLGIFSPVKKFMWNLTMVRFRSIYSTYTHNSDLVCQRQGLYLEGLWKNWTFILFPTVYMTFFWSRTNLACFQFF